MMTNADRAVYDATYDASVRAARAAIDAQLGMTDLAEACRCSLNKAEVIDLSGKYKVADINAAIKKLRAEATELRRKSGDLYVASDYLADEIRRRAEAANL